MRTGNIFEVAEVLKHLHYLSQVKPLSFREQRMLSDLVTWWYRSSPQSAANRVQHRTRVDHALRNLAHGTNAGPTVPLAPPPQAATEPIWNALFAFMPRHDRPPDGPV